LATGKALKNLARASTGELWQEELWQELPTLDHHHHQSHVFCFPSLLGLGPLPACFSDLLGYKQSGRHFAFMRR